MQRKTLRLVAILLVVSATIGATLVVAEEVSDPNFRVDVYNHGIFGYGWTEGTTVTLTIDDPSNGPGVDYEDSQVVPPGAPYFAFSNVMFLPDREEEFQLAPGQLVTLDDGTLQKELTITTLTVTLVDPAADTISGTADPDAQVSVHAFGDGEDAERFPTADAGGYWLADFSEPGDDPLEDTVIDIAPCQVSFWVLDHDSDGDSTAVFWPYDPRFEVRPSAGHVSGKGWLEEATVTLSIYDSEGTELLYTASQVAAPDEWQWHATSVSFDLPEDPEGFEIEPGQIVRMNDGVSFKEHVVPDIAVTNVDVNADVVLGTAAPSAELVVRIWEEGFQSSREVQASSDGLWVADFSVGEDPYDIDESTTGWIDYVDDDEDSTRLFWSARFRVTIDIKPGSSKNSLNLGSQGVLAVALLTTEGFDVGAADPETVQFAGAIPLRWSSKDVDSDGDLDLLFKVKIPELDLTTDSTNAFLRGMTYGGRPFVGWDSVNIVP